MEVEGKWVRLSRSLSFANSAPKVKIPIEHITNRSQRRPSSSSGTIISARYPEMVQLSQ